MIKKTENLSSVEKALKILKLISENYEGLRTLDISEKLDLSTSTASRLLIILAKQDFVRKSPISKKYILGNSILDIGRFSQLYFGAQLVPVASNYIDSLRDKIEESVVLEILVNDNSVIVYRANGPNVISVSIKAGTTIPAHVSPGAKAILAFSTQDTVDSILKIKLPGYTSKTITNIDTIKKEFEEIRRTGIAFANGEYNIELNAMGVPIFNKDKNPVAAVVITMPKYRSKHHKKEELISALKNTAVKISEQIIKNQI